MAGRAVDFEGAQQAVAADVNAALFVTLAFAGSRVLTFSLVRMIKDRR